MQCRNCRANWDDTLNFCGRCGQRLRGSGTTANVDLPVNAAPDRIVHAPGRWVSRGNLLVVTEITLVVLLVCSMLTTSSAGTARISMLPVRVTASPSSIPVRMPEGLAWFYDLHGQNDGVGLYIRYLAPPPQGKVYVGWLINPHRPDEQVPLSPLTLNSGGELVFMSDMVPSFNANVQNLRMMFTQVAVTLENAATTFRRPVGPMVMQGLLNQDALGDLDLLFTSDPSTPAQVALLPGFHQQMRELDRWVTNMLDAQQRNDVVSVHVDQMRILYILEGAQGANVLDLNLAEQPGVVGAGDGFGLLPSGTDCQSNQSSCGYLAAIRIIVERLSIQGVVTDLTRQNLLTTLKTLEALAYNIQQQALSLLGFTTLDAPTLQSLALFTAQIDAMLNGVDRDGDGSIDAVPGEAATAQLYTYMQQVGAVKLMSANA